MWWLAMSKLIKILLVTVLLVFIPAKVSGEDVRPGYSEWSTTKSGLPGEISTIQYGRKLPIEWSSWSTDNPSSFTKDFKSKIDETPHYAYGGAGKFWSDVNAKTLYTWNFGYKANVIYAYLDVDTYRSGYDDNYEAPPLQLYCDGREIASIGKHHELANWSPSINASCSYMELKMSANPGGGRNRTVIVGTWVTTTSTLYSYVTKWNEGVDWRFSYPYERKYGENPEIPTQRNVYSHPITYRINYNLDGGEFVGTPTYTYTVNDEVYIPSAYKKGYEFLGFYDESGNLVNKINKGTYRDITLTARYKRNPPTLYIGYTYFDKDDTPISIEDLVNRVNGKALDEVDGDISKDIKVSQIVYEQSDNVVYNPSHLDISTPGCVYITFYVYNSENVKAELKRRYYILDYGQDIEDYSSDLKIYSRYIDEEFKDTLVDGSIWKESDYAYVLNEAYRRYRSD